MEQDFIARTVLDEMVESDRDQLVKAVLPYLPFSGQRLLSMYVKTRELSNTMALFRDQRNHGDLQAASVSVSDPLAMLQDIRRYCNGENRKQIDRATNLMAMLQMIRIMNEDPTGGENP